MESTSGYLLNLTSLLFITIKNNPFHLISSLLKNPTRLWEFILGLHHRIIIEYLFILYF